MEYNKIISVTGLPGLYELINTKSDGAVVRSLEDKSTKFASSRIHNFSHLESIEVYTTGENVNLAEVFHAMEESGSSIPATKDDSEIKKYFERVYPDIDFERVYNSDLKKMIKWFEVLKKNNIEIKISEPEEETETTIEEEEEKEPAKKEEKRESSTSRPPKSEKSKKTTKKEDKTEKKSPASKNDKSAKKSPAKKRK